MTKLINLKFLIICVRSIIFVHNGYASDRPCAYKKPPTYQIAKMQQLVKVQQGFHQWLDNVEQKIRAKLQDYYFDITDKRVAAILKSMDWAKARQLIHQGADITSINTNMDGARNRFIHYVVACNHTNMMHFLIKQGVMDINANNSNTKLTPLHIAAELGYTKAVKILLSVKHIVIHAYDRKGETPLHKALRQGHAEIVNILASAMGIPIHVPVTAIEQSCKQHLANLLEVQQAFRKWLNDNLGEIIQTNHTTYHAVYRLDDAALSALRYIDWHKAQAFIHQGADCTSRVYIGSGDNGWDIIHYAAAANHLEMLKWLIQKGKIDVNTKGVFQLTPLHIAAELGHTEVVKLLLSVKHIAIHACDIHNESPLHKAIYKGHIEVAHLLASAMDIDACHFCNIQQSFAKWLKEVAISIEQCVGTQPYTVWNIIEHKALPALKKIDWHQAKKLIMQGTDISVGDANGWTIMHYATAANNIEMLQWLLQQGIADVNSKMAASAYTTPLHIAVKWGYTEAIKTLLSVKDIAVNARDYFGNTPLQDAVAMGHVTIVKMLASADHVDIDCPDSAGWTPLLNALCKHNINKEIVKILIANGANRNVQALKAQTFENPSIHIAYESCLEKPTIQEVLEAIDQI